MYIWRRASGGPGPTLAQSNLGYCLSFGSHSTRVWISTKAAGFFGCDGGGFGGTLLSYMAAHFDFRRTNNDLFSRACLKVLCKIEDTLIAMRILEDEFIYVLRRANLAGWPDARA
jgi:hypothetical protein